MPKGSNGLTNEGCNLSTNVDSKIRAKLKIRSRHNGVKTYINRFSYTVGDFDPNTSMFKTKVKLQLVHERSNKASMKDEVHS